MYVRYAERMRWKAEITDANYSSVNGIKDATIETERAASTFQAAADEVQLDRSFDVFQSFTAVLRAAELVEVLSDEVMPVCF